MSRAAAPCPGCGAEVEFAIGSSVVAVCRHCRSAVARGDARLEDLGKVAELVESGSPLALGLEGCHLGTPFLLVGRAQLRHAAGGLWDEWYAAFGDGRWGWLAEAQGKFYLTFRQRRPVEVPPLEALEPGQPLGRGKGLARLVVAEKGEATVAAAAGEIPYRLDPGLRYPYADLSGPSGEFATIDYGESPPLVFVGREVTLDELGLGAAAPPRREPKRVAAEQLSCPKCGGPLELRAPDKTERVGCPYCGSLLDASQGKLAVFQVLKTPRVRPAIPLGTAADLEGERLTVIGFLQRSVSFEGINYFWTEYLLYHPKVGFRWLVHSDGHWSYVKPVPPGAVREGGSGSQVAYQGRRFKLFQRATAMVRYVLGECYWKVEVGETAKTEDYVSPPEILSREWTADEVTWSLGSYLPKEEVERAFKVEIAPEPVGVAPNQPFLHKGVYLWWAALTAAALAVFVAIGASRVHRTAFEKTYAVERAEERVFFSDPFELVAGQNVMVAAYAPVDYTWLYVEGDLYNQETGLVQGFSVPIEFYHGFEGGESWSEGDRSPEVFVSALPAGTYTMRLEVEREQWLQPIQLSVRVEQGVARIAHLGVVLALLAALPAVVGLWHCSFERQRWKESEFNPYE